MSILFSKPLLRPGYPLCLGNENVTFLLGSWEWMPKKPEPSGNVPIPLFWPMRAKQYNQTDPRRPITWFQICCKWGAAVAERTKWLIGLSAHAGAKNYLGTQHTYIHSERLTYKERGHRTNVTYLCTERLSAKQKMKNYFSDGLGLNFWNSEWIAKATCPMWAVCYLQFCYFPLCKHSSTCLQICNNNNKSFKVI